MTPAPLGGFFITFEGGEGAGKSSQVKRLADHLRHLGAHVTLTREPGGSPGAERLRELLLSGAVRDFGPAAEAMIFSAARIDHLDHTIRPALARGEVVICDRFIDSTRAYQGASGQIEPAFLDMLERIAIGPTRPHLTLILDLPPHLGIARANLRRGADKIDRFESEALSFHEHLRQTFRAIAQAEPDRCCLIDASATEAEVAASIWSKIIPHLPAMGLGAQAQTMEPFA
jgi:dTMP kinase